MKTKIYTAHEKADIAEPSARVELVREGFSWFAFILGGLWLPLRGLWVATLFYALLVFVIVYVGESFGVGEAGMAAIQIFVQLLLGFSAYDLLRESLTRRGYQFKGVVVAESELNAERRYHDSIA